ncbi:PREDICTED: uncharacterized protein LOC109231021 [Nicotiana attenuata]|uniref:AT hook motif-containing protein n=1 Tax=Nicotiana attenuata TaxID=49451 RepID=A0A1J6IFR7_NICAT|nr:PREDICTED: uncharacterized protein LOC109231021 [Nicotiana attenuata]OIS99375.1 hypothetical protein A4A49_30308 [Nicotiana attenuata]
MNEQTTQDNNPTAPTILPAKRRRGRPRKDGGVAKRGNLQSPVTPPPPETIKKVQQNAVELSQRDGSIVGGNNIIGQMVSGVVDGCFDAGYFISVRVGNSATTLRGLVFQPGRFAPITPANDVAPSATMYHRNQVSTPLLNLQQENQPNVAPAQVLPSKPMSSATFVPNNSQFAPVMAPQSDTVMTSNEARSKIMLQQNQSQSTLPLENLRMVEQDEVMQVFEVTNQSEGTEINAEPTKGMFSESLLEPKASEGTSNQNQVMGSTFQPAVDHQSIESESKNDKQLNPEQSYMQTLLQPGEFVHCEAKKLEIHRAPINAQTQVDFQGLSPMNEDIQMKDWTQSGQENQQNQFNQSSLFAELNSVAQETQAAETQVIEQNHTHMMEKLHYVEMPEATNENSNADINQVVVTSETQAAAPESIKTSMDFMMEKLSYSKNEESQNTHVGTEVELAVNAETSNETKEASDPGDKLVLGSQLASQQEEAETGNSDQSAKVETQNKSCDGGNNNLEIVNQGQQNQP